KRASPTRYSVQFKLDTLKYMIETGSTPLETAIQFNLNHSSTVRRWYRELYGRNVDRLNSSLKGQSIMTERSKDNKENQEENTENIKRKTIKTRKRITSSGEFLFKKAKSFSGEPECLSRKAQASMAFQLQKEGFRLKDILVTVGIPEATYHYQVKTFGKVDKD